MPHFTFIEAYIGSITSALSAVSDQFCGVRSKFYSRRGVKPLSPPTITACGHSLESAVLAQDGRRSFYGLMVLRIRTILFSGRR
jgi:hypothetical protein